MSNVCNESLVLSNTAQEGLMGEEEGMGNERAKEIEKTKRGLPPS